MSARSAGPDGEGVAVVPWTRWDWLLLVIPAAVLCALASQGLGHRTFWYDEVSSVLIARNSLPDLAQTIATSQAYMSVYHLILHFWLFIGETEGRVRLLSVIAAALATLPVNLVARRVAGRMAGLLAALVFAVHPFVLAYAREARGYALAMLAAALITWLLVRAVERPAVDRWALYGVAAAIGIYVQFFIAFVILAHVIVLGFSARLPRAPALVAAGAPIAIAVAPLPLIVSRQGGGIGWIGPLTIDGFLGMVSTLAGGWPLLLLSIPLMAYAVVAHPRSIVLRLVLASLIVPLALATGISLVKPVLVARYLAVVSPAIAILVGAGISAMRRQPTQMLRAVTVVVLVALVAVGLVPVYARTNFDWRSATYWMAEELQPGDRVVYEKPISGREVVYYLGRVGVSRAPEQISLQEAEAEPIGRVWIVMSGLGLADRERIKRDLERLYLPLAGRYLGSGVEVGIYAPRNERTPE